LVPQGNITVVHCSTHSGKCGIVFQDESKFNNNDKKIIQKLGMDGKPG
jgi:hypothetical protein